MTLMTNATRLTAVLAGLAMVAAAGSATSTAAADDGILNAYADAASNEITVGDSWYDVDGNLVEAHGGAANYYLESEINYDVTGDGDLDDGVYLLYGEKKTNATRPVDGVNGYWSTDLVNWHSMGTVLPTHNVQPLDVVTIGDEGTAESYTDVDGVQYFADHKVDQTGSSTSYSSQKYTVVSETNLEELKRLANLSEEEAAAEGSTEDAASARQFIEPYVEERDANGKAVSYDDDSLKLGFEYLYGMYDIVERPKMIYNAATKQYVIIFHSDGSTNANEDRINWIEGLNEAYPNEPTKGKQYFDEGHTNNGSRYSRAQIGYAVSDSPFGPFKLVNSTRMNYDKSLHSTRFGESRDMTVFIDTGHDVNGDGVDDAYAVYSSEMNAKMYISLLNADYTGPIAEGDSAAESDTTWRSRVLPDNSREASAIFYWNGWYYMITSGTDGWNSTGVIYYRAKSMLQDEQWERIGNPFVGANNAKGYDSQPTYVLVKDQDNGEFIYMGDRWSVDSSTGSAGKDSKLIWLPIELTDDEDNPIRIEGRESWDPFDSTLYRAAKDLGSIALEQGSLLPDSLTIDGKDTPVMWESGAADEVASASAFDTVELSLTAADARYTVSVTVLPAGTQYYVDSGAEAASGTSAEYEAVKAAVPGLLNEVADKASADGSWGYDATNIVAKSGATATESGLYTNNGGATISYTLDRLPAGDYTLTAGFHDWWAQYTDNRKMDLKILDADGTQLGSTGSATTSKSVADTTGTVSFSLDKSQTVTFQVTRASGASADPILNWFAVAKSAKSVGFVGVAVDGTLPQDVTVGDAAEPVAWSEASKTAVSSKADVSERVNVLGETADGTVVSGYVQTVSDHTVYFIDSGASSAGIEYESVKAAAGDSFLNGDAADQRWDGVVGSDGTKTWGYSTGSKGGAATAGDADDWQSSYIGAEYDNRDGRITYHLTLPAGVYQIGTAQAPRAGYTTNVYSEVSLGDTQLAARKTATSTGEAVSVVQTVTVPAAADGSSSVVDVVFGTNGNSGYNARLALVWANRVVPDMTALEAAIAQAESKNEADYTAESWAVLESALAEARTIVASETATQSEVDAAAAALIEAQRALVANDSTDVDDDDKTDTGDGNDDTTGAGDGTGAGGADGKDTGDGEDTAGSLSETGSSVAAVAGIAALLLAAGMIVALRRRRA